jgi:hypothetical protein
MNRLRAASCFALGLFPPEDFLVPDFRFDFERRFGDPPAVVRFGVRRFLERLPELVEGAEVPPRRTSGGSGAIRLIASPIGRAPSWTPHGIYLQPRFMVPSLSSRPAPVVAPHGA